MKSLTVSILFALALSASAQTFTTTSKAKKQAKAAPPPPLEQRQPQGALQRGARGGNVLQMFNPKAPAKYGTAADSLVMDETGKWRGIKLFEFFF
jgi:threonine/homoserine/homoserine lactone efflux protein